LLSLKLAPNIFEHLFQNILCTPNLFCIIIGFCEFKNTSSFVDWSLEIMLVMFREVCCQHWYYGGRFFLWGRGGRALGQESVMTTVEDSEAAVKWQGTQLDWMVGPYILGIT
jgi:hypothetical protein